MLLPPATYRLYRATDDVRRSYELRLEREIGRVSEDIDSFRSAIQNLFEEIKTILVGKIRNTEYEFRQQLTRCTQNVEHYLQDTWKQLVDEQRKNQYTALKAFSEDCSEDRNVDELQQRRRLYKRSENALKLIKNNQSHYKIGPLTESIEACLSSSQSIYGRQQLRRLLSSFREDVVSKLEDMDLFRDGHIIKRIAGRSSEQPAGPKHAFRPADASRPALLQDLDSVILEHTHSLSNFSEEEPLPDKPPIGRVSCRQRQTRQTPADASSQLRGAGDSLATNKHRKRMIEERERLFRQGTEAAGWRDRPLQPQEDSGSAWNFIQSLKNHFFGADH